MGFRRNLPPTKFLASLQFALRTVGLSKASTGLSDCGPSQGIHPFRYPVNIIILYIKYFAIARKIISDRARQPVNREICLSFNHIYHRLSLIIDAEDANPADAVILVQQFIPKHMVNQEMLHNPAKSNDYNYLFKVPDDSKYQASKTWLFTDYFWQFLIFFSFKHHNLDRLNWSRLDSELQTANRCPHLFTEEMKCFFTRF